MSNLPTITDVVTYLRGTGMEGMALAVEELERACARSRIANKQNVERCDPGSACQQANRKQPPESEG